MTNLDEKTRVNLWSILAMVPAVVFVIFWVSMVSFKADVTAGAVEKLEKDQKEIGNVINDIHDRIIRIEEKITHNKGCVK